MKFESKILNRERKTLEFIGLYEIIGGIIGIGLIFLGKISLDRFSIFGVLIMALIIAFYSFSIYAGIKLFRHHEKEVLYSKIVQYVQIPSFALLGFMFTMTAGFSFFIGFDYTNDFLFRAFFELPSVGTKFYIKSDDTIIYVYLNLIPIIINFLIEKSASKIEMVKEKIEIIKD